jgi:hypothetical protein
VPVPRRAGRLVAALLVFGLAFSVLGGAAAPVSAAQDPAQAQIAQALTDLEAARQAARDASQRLEAARQRQADLDAQIAAVQAKIADLNARIPVLQAQADQLRSYVRQRAAILYRSTGPYATTNDPFDLSTKTLRRRQLANALAKHDEDVITQLNATVEQLTAAKADLGHQQDDLARQQAEANQIAAGLAAQQAELDRRVGAANAAYQRAQLLGALSLAGKTRVTGPTVLTGPQMAAWYRSRGYSPRLATSIDVLAQIYVEEGSSENVRGDLAFAQAIVETGGFSSAPDNNYAGMGWCDSCSYGTRFPTPRDGVRAQIQHLKNYADATSRSSGLSHPPSPYWYGSDPATAARHFDTFFAKGWAPTWDDMGHGNWATDPNYSGKVLRIYQSMVAFAQAN